jgi:hypothetical protein
MPQNITGEEPRPPAPICRTGDEITFKFEGNVRATVEGFEEVGGTLWVVARASLRFTVPPSLVVGVERGRHGDD